MSAFRSARRLRRTSDGRPSVAVDGVLPRGAAQVHMEFEERLRVHLRHARGNRFVLGYGGANDYGDHSVVVEESRARDAVVLLTNADKTHAERFANRIAPLVFV